MPFLLVQITRFVDEHFPGIVECELIDAVGNRHFFIEKVPVVSDENLCAESIYPCHGVIGCEVENEWLDDKGNLLVQINTDQPWHIESTKNEIRFTVFASQLNYL
jgi:hypothetical protein